jgi:hypothetical protein
MSMIYRMLEATRKTLQTTKDAMQLLKELEVIARQRITEMDQLIQELEIAFENQSEAKRAAKITYGKHNLQSVDIESEIKKLGEMLKNDN